MEKCLNSISSNVKNEKLIKNDDYFYRTKVIVESRG